MAEHDVEKIWHDFWVPCLDGALEGKPLGRSIAIPSSYFDQIKRELYDFHQMMDGLSVMYDDITGGHATKPNTDKRVIAQLVDERRQASYAEGFEEGKSVGYEDGYADGYADG